MKNFSIRHRYIFVTLLSAFTWSSCSQDVLDKIDQNPNAPTDVSLKLLLPQVTMNAVYSLTGGYTAAGISTYVEHTTSVRQNTIDPADVAEQLWTNTYYGLTDLTAMIKKAEEQQNFSYLGIGQVLYAYNLSQLTDVYGDVPLTEALGGSEIRAPKFDSQESVYKYMLELLDQAIANLNKTSPGNPGSVDLVFAGDLGLWRKTAYGLKARLQNRLSNIDPQGSATQALAALGQSFGPGEGFIFKRYKEGTAYDNPWSGLQGSQEIFAVSTTMVNLMQGFAGTISEDPRSDRWFSKIGGKVVGAPGGSASIDQGHLLYSQPSRTNVLTGAAQQPILTYDELKFIEAEADLRLGNRPAALTAYTAAVRAAMIRAGVAIADIDKYLLKPTVLPPAGDLTLAHIIGQKYMAFWLFQSIEAYNDARRTGIPNVLNAKGLPKRMPYPNSEVSRNPNTPTNINNITIYTMPVWWGKK